MMTLDTEQKTPEVILVTGGTGLIGNGIQYSLKHGPEAFTRRPHETWIFANSKNADLRFVLDNTFMVNKK